MWGGAVALLALPFIAMRLDAGPNWGPGDFFIVGVMLAALCGLVEFAARRSSSGPYRWAMGLAALGGFLVIWVNLAVGIVASEDNPYNLVFLAIVVATVAGSIIGRARPKAMARILPVTAASLLIALGIGQMLGSDELHDTRLAEWVGVTIFAAIFAGSALLFRRAGA